MMDDINSNSDSSIEPDSDASKSEFHLQSISQCIFTLDMELKKKIQNLKFSSKEFN